jgi:hypothetical protein
VGALCIQHAYFAKGFVVDVRIFYGRHVVFASYDTTKAIPDKGLDEGHTETYAFIQQFVKNIKYPTYLALRFLVILRCFSDPFLWFTLDLIERSTARGVRRGWCPLLDLLDWARDWRRQINTERKINLHGRMK